MTGGGVSGGRFHQMNQALGGSAQHGPFYAAVLISEGDFKVVDIFTVALEPEMAGLDDARVNGPDGYLVYLGSAYLKIICNTNLGGNCVRAVAAGSI